MATNIVPMAGLGSRFASDGYKLPKPLIPVSGLPMIIRAIRSMPPADNWVFLVRQEHIDEFKIDELLRKEKPGCRIVPVKELTQGQACTCLLAMPYVDPSESLYIGSCDTAAVFDHERYTALTSQSAVDCIVWTMTEQPTMRIRPEKHGWCKLAPDGQFIADMSVKIPVSSNPFSDHAVIGSFWFRTAKDFIDATELMIAEDYRANNEFYVDALPVFLNKMKKRSAIFDVAVVISWGTPADLYYYQYLEYCFSQGLKPTLIADTESSFCHWKSYFSSHIA